MKRVEPKRKPTFRVGQVVRINTDFYKHGEREKQQYQRIMAIEPWGDKSYPGFCCRFMNGDAAHEQWLKPLTANESGRKP